jgi:hypothetical protein
MKSSSLKIILFTVLGACSQGRDSLLVGDRSLYWGPQKLCSEADTVNGNTCFDVSLNVSRNQVEFFVDRIDPLAVELGYRVVVFYEGSQYPEVIGSNLDYTAGETFLLDVPMSGDRDVTFISEWLVETEQNVSSNGVNFAYTEVGYGFTLANAIIDWKELFENPYGR